MSLRNITATLAEVGHLNERGTPFNAKSWSRLWTCNAGLGH